MAESIQTDSDAGSQSQTGVGKVDQATRALHQVQPNWIEDGHGIVGPRRQVVIPQSARPRKMEFKFDNSSHDEPFQGKITVTTEDASGYAAGSGVDTVNNVDTLTFDQDMFEIFDGGGGQCVVKLKTCDAECGATKCGDGDGC